MFKVRQCCRTTQMLDCGGRWMPVRRCQDKSGQYGHRNLNPIDKRYLSTPNDEAQRPVFDKEKKLAFTQPPSPDWKIGDGGLSSRLETPGETAKRKRWDLGNGTSTTDTSSNRDTYKLLSSAIIPRPIAFVSTLSPDGVPNLAPFSYFSMISHNPPMISISFSLSTRRPKDTRENILSTKEFTVNIISETFAEAANATSVESPADTNEWLISGLTPEPSTSVKPSLVQESAVGMECELYSFQDICAPNTSEVTTTVVLGLIKQLHIREDVLDETGKSIDPAKLRPIARLGGTSYARLVEAFDLPRIPWKVIGQSYNALLG